MFSKCATVRLQKTLKFQILLLRYDFNVARAKRYNSHAINRCEEKKLPPNKFSTPAHNCVRAASQYKQKRQLSFDSFAKFLKKLFPNMDDTKMLGVFKGQVDRFKGVTVDSMSEYDCKVDFEEKLRKSLCYWIENNRRAIWFKVRSEHSDWIPILTKYEFDFHHAGQGFATLQRWLPQDEGSNLPDYAHSLVGVGGLVINPKKLEVLVVTDRYAAIPGSWKLPGGYVNPKENLIDAAIREVKEETGVVGEYRTMVSLRHSHGGNFDCSDLYFVIALFAKTSDLKPCEREISRVSWMPIAEYLNHPNVHETNRHTMKTYLDYERRGIRLDCLTATHQILKKDYQIFYARALDKCEKIHVPPEKCFEKKEAPEKVEEKKS